MARRLLVFDPGGTTGFAALNLEGGVILTAALTFTELDQLLASLKDTPDKVVIEQGPQWGHHSPATKRAEAVCRDTFPNATLVPPNQWKKHPATKDVPKYATQHERDAVMLGRWFLAIGESNEENPAATNAAGPRRKRN